MKVQFLPSNITISYATGPMSFKQGQETEMAFMCMCVLLVDNSD
jgi:hypothetical protein